MSELAARCAVFSLVAQSANQMFLGGEKVRAALRIVFFFRIRDVFVPLAKIRTQVNYSVVFLAV